MPVAPDGWASAPAIPSGRRRARLVELPGRGARSASPSAARGTPWRRRLTPGGSLSPGRRRTRRLGGVSSGRVADHPVRTRGPARPASPGRSSTSRGSSRVLSRRSGRSPAAGWAFVDLPRRLPPRTPGRGRRSRAARLPLASPLGLDLPDASLDAIVSLWSGVPGRGRSRPAPRPTACCAPTAGCSSSTTTAATTSAGCATRTSPEYRVWSRREGPFLAGAEFKIRVLHCFWTFASIEEAQAFLVEAFGETGRGRRVAA